MIERLDGIFANAPDQRFTVDLHGEDATLLAAWLTDETWARLREALAYLDHIEWDRKTTIGFQAGTGAGSTYGDTHSAIMDALSALERDAEDRLSSRAELPAFDYSLSL